MAAAFGGALNTEQQGLLAVIQRMLLGGWHDDVRQISARVEKSIETARGQQSPPLEALEEHVALYPAKIFSECAAADVGGSMLGRVSVSESIASSSCKLAGPPPRRRPLCAQMCKGASRFLFASEAHSTGTASGGAAQASAAAPHGLAPHHAHAPHGAAACLWACCAAATWRRSSRRSSRPASGGER
jgi:hypothetical protein